MFNWMNRRLYHFFKHWIRVLGFMLLVLAGIVCVVAIFAWADSMWGPKGFFGALVTFFLLGISIGTSWIMSKDSYEEEVREQNRIERSLRRDWTK